MISTKEELHNYILADYLANEGKNAVSQDVSLRQTIRRLLGQTNEFDNVRHFLRILRKYEYYHNTKTGGVIHKIMERFFRFRYRRLSMKMRIRIPINTVGKGFRISHYVGGVIVNCISMGEYCSVASGVVIGNKDSQDNRAIIGNHVKFTLGSKLFGKISVGDNVIIAPNSVVIKDIESNTVVSGVPAKVIKRLETNKICVNLYD